MVNLYNYYIYNIYQLLTKYKLNYYWFDLNEQFYNGIINNNYSNYKFYNNNYWLNKYKDNKIGLGQDILKNGMFTPIFFQIINNKKYIILGRHRYYSLLMNHYLNPINKKFLFIEIPNNKNPIQLINQKLYQFTDKPKDFIPKSYEDICNLLLQTGDNLTPYLQNNLNIQPFKIFQDEQLLENWLKEEINEKKLLCSIG